VYLYDGWVAFNIESYSTYVWPVRDEQWVDSVISGSVLDAVTYLTLSDATVNIGGTRIVQTDANGAYRINVVPDVYSVTASKSGYITQSTSVTSTRGQATVQNFTLSPPATPPVSTHPPSVRQ
jgi:Carboxypeptidase regulatory-like domain